MNVARAKLDLIKPEEVNMDEYEVRSSVLWIFFFFYLLKMLVFVSRACLQ